MNSTIPLRQKLRVRRLFFATLTVVLVLGGLGTALWLVFTNTDLRQQAFTGFELLPGALPVGNGGRSAAGPAPDSATTNDPNPLTSDSNLAPIAQLFHDLTRRYPQAPMQNIFSPDLPIAGVAFSQYDEAINTTFFFLRLTNLPQMEVSPVQMWLHNPTTKHYRKVGLMQFVDEQQETVLYGVTTFTGDARQDYQQFIVSYDARITDPQPILPVLKLTL